ncbi:50S ribosomal protein L5 [Candidatus Arthromitus sp. SFB-mouse-Japan]|nr:LSU ribosomal protein L5 [Candidatus Arthromitus sp. SFB-mouse-NL]EIA24219.1 50S ribosomal protein L5 [Candidatus Arthromitus sp. SFB-1]EIA25993.1 50S ribosomal protein L5 [Candidatus Arthromitus sp. SFB-3]EIA27571.1 50S ribosomal protein L5 [Candidatus Arthromitus sp. SFB-4]EIA28872.1 50S ribosomal protein L5 [Candidatus Arthromitus sp. SFB-co]EIA30162.1 50S ribosomal protein L5 [Candidatus Arthromitus sp. SFB-mouse-SU]BAK57143.1 50S ribosomal protein L5 [Candidatus Arthromitus sp. SFB-mo
MSRLKEKYINEVTSKLVEKFKYSNLMQVPKIEKVVINMGVGEAKDNSKVLESVVNDMQLISGQKPIICRAKKSISNFKLRENMPIGCKVTLRKSRMYDFIDKLFNVALPRVRDFRGVSEKSFDGRGNYTLGLKEHLIFPEIEYDKIDKIRGIEVIFVTTAKTDEEARELLRYLGMPFMS